MSVAGSPQDGGAQPPNGSMQTRQSRRRYYVAVHEGIVVGSRTSLKRYTYALLHMGMSGTWATFHETLAHAVHARAAFKSSAPTKTIVRALETREWLALGSQVLH